MNQTAIEQWWILPNGDERQVPADDPFGIIFENPADSGLTQDDCAFAKQNAGGGGLLALIDRICWAGGLWIRIDGDPTKQWATICFWNERAQDGEFNVAPYRRIAQWLRNRKASKKAIVLLRELSTMRGWMQPVEMLLTAPEDQFTDKPGHDRCPGCHKHVSHQEIMEKRQCPHCGMMLV